MKTAKQNKIPSLWKFIALTSACALITSSASAGQVELTLDYNETTQGLAVIWLNEDISDAYMSMKDDYLYTQDSIISAYSSGTAASHDYGSAYVSGLQEAITAINSAGTFVEFTTDATEGYEFGSSWGSVYWGGDAGMTGTFTFSGVTAGEFATIESFAASIVTSSTSGISAVNVVPEPATAGLLGCTAILLFFVRRLRKITGLLGCF